MLHPFNLLLHPFNLLLHPFNLLLHLSNLLLHSFNPLLHPFVLCLHPSNLLLHPFNLLLHPSNFLKHYFWGAAECWFLFWPFLTLFWHCLKLFWCFLAPFLLFWRFNHLALPKWGFIIEFSYGVVLMLFLTFAQKSYNSCKTTLHHTVGLMDFQRKLQLHNWGTSIQHTINKIYIQCNYKLMFIAGRRVPCKANFPSDHTFSCHDKK